MAEAACSSFVANVSVWQVDKIMKSTNPFNFIDEKGGDTGLIPGVSLIAGGLVVGGLIPRTGLRSKPTPGKSWEPAAFSFYIHGHRSNAV